MPWANQQPQPQPQQQQQASGSDELYLLFKTHLIISTPGDLNNGGYKFHILQVYGVTINFFKGQQQHSDNTIQALTKLNNDNVRTDISELKSSYAQSC